MKLIAEQPPSYTLNDLLDFTLEHRDKVFGEEWTEQEIAEYLIERYQHKEIIIYVSEKDQVIIGFLTFWINQNLQQVHVRHILATRPEVLEKAAQFYLHLFGADCKFKVTATRNGKIKIYNTPRLIKRILCQTLKSHQ